MEQSVTLLQRISQTAYKTHETVKTIASYPDISNMPYVCQLKMLIGEIQAISISLTFKIITKSSKNELSESIHIMYKSMECGLEMYSMLKSSLPESVPENLKEWLEKNMVSLKTLLLELAPSIQSIYSKEGLDFDISPAFLGCSNSAEKNT